MRLNQIKLSGFKSFAEPTVFQLPGQRVGVVGPNGCGKSNLIDAVRWVLGESKASELRGESMQDVIFNGSGQRKPASRASVELVFGNEDARAGGQWNQYAEIAVKRVLTRDGASSYYINNQPVRRRDVQDVFLGTGLGPRAYAIIGQGTISRLVESRPEELRLFLEEAAGVSKYKERRRETETRLKDTRENLTRIDDIARELDAQLGRLEQQAEVATRWRTLHDASTLKLHQLWWLKMRDAGDEAARVARRVDEATNALEARLAELRHLEAGLEGLRESHYASNDRLHAAQGALAEAALEVSRLEERIRHVVERRRQTEARLNELHLKNAQWADRRTQAEAELEALAEQIAAADAARERLAALVEQGQRELPALDEALRGAQASALAQRTQVGAVQQQLQLLAAETRHLDEQQRELRGRGERLTAESRALAAPDPAQLESLRAAHAHAERERALADERLQTLHDQVPALDGQRRERQQQAQHEAHRHADISARLAALRALQEKVQTQDRLRPWLVRHGLESLPALWTRLHIEPGWEPALEAALRERLNALAVGKIELVRAFAADPPPARLAFYTPPPQGAVNASHALPRLADLLRFEGADAQALKPLLGDWLAGVWTAASLEDALAARDRLAQGEVVMTREGHAVSAHTVSFYAPDSEQAGLLARAQEIENLDRQQRAQTLIADEARAAAVRAEAAYAEAAQQLALARREAADAQTRTHRLQVQRLELEQQASAAQARRGQLDQELADIDARQATLDERRRTGETRFDELDQQLAAEQEREAGLDDAVGAAGRRLAGAREQLRAREHDAQEAQFHARSLVQRRGELERAIHTAIEQAGANTQAGEQLTLELGALDDSAAKAGLQTAVELRLEREQRLRAARAEYDDLAAQLRGADEQRMRIEHDLDPMRAQITALQLEQQAAHLGAEQQLDQLRAAEVDVDALGEAVARDGVKLWGLQGEIERLQREVQALGAVNLAALDELAAARERKTFLDAQAADLKDAIGTLEDAIHKIDAETREMLGRTFDEVNAHFGRLFPSLFGGGSARLAMTGDEILDAGVQVMAQPPGKRNSTIHLLSGGEKALTAIALVFAIFLLNPAPFCLLDEVDAPLDDANVERYGKLVTEMSARGTQFLFISHNKLTMEIAEQLVGVTMPEQGVSRIVAVDMDAAVGMAEAA